MARLSISLIITIVTMSLLCACAPTGPAVKKRLFWPTPPNEPKVEWIGTFSSVHDLKTDAPSLFNLIVGEDDAVALERPLSIASDGHGKVYVTDAETATPYVFDFNDKNVYKVGGDAADGLFQQITGIAVDGNGSVYVADTKYRKIFVFDRENRPVKTIVLANELDSIGNFAIDKTRNRIIVPDFKNNMILVTDLDGKVLLSFGRKGDGDGEFNLPLAVAIEKDGGIVVCDSFNARIQRFTSQGTFVNKFGRRGDAPGDLSTIKGVAVDSEGHLYVTDGKANRITIFSTSGDTLLVVGNTFAQVAGSKLIAGGFLIPQGIAIDQNDRIYVVDQLNRRFQIFQYLNPRYLTDFPVTEPTATNAK